MNKTLLLKDPQKLIKEQQNQRNSNVKNKLQDNKKKQELPRKPNKLKLLDNRQSKRPEKRKLNKQKLRGKRQNVKGKHKSIKQDNRIQIEYNKTLISQKFKMVWNVMLEQNKWNAKEEYFKAQTLIFLVHIIKH